jgi:hypothetical protein
MKSHGIKLTAASLMMACVACAPTSSGPVTPNPGSAGTNAGGSGGGAGAGVAGASGVAGAAAGTGGSGVAGASGVAGTGVAGAAGAAGTGPGGRGGAAGAATGGRGGTAGGASGGRGGSAAGAGGSGVAGAGGGATGGATGTATFTVQVQLASAMMAMAPGTIGIVTWTVNVPSLVEARIDFGLDTSYGMSAPVDLALADHRTLLLGMKPAKLYHFRVVARDATMTYTSGDYTVMTGPAPTTVSISRFQVMNATARKRGFIVTSYWQGTGSAVPFIIDGDGEIVWWGRSGPTGGIARAVMSADGKNMWMTTANNNGANIQRLSMDTLSAQTYTGSVGSHDITPVSGETMAFLEYGETDCDSIYEIDPSGTKREVWESQGVVMASGCHGNALRYSQKEDVYTFSDVRQDVFVVSRAGAVMWRLSQRVMGGAATWGMVQHGHHLLDNSIVILANSGAGMNMSAMIEYSLTGQEIARFVPGEYTANLGDVQRLPGGNTLVTISNASVMKEIDPQGTVVLQINGASGTRFGYALWRETLYGPPPDISQ